MGYIPKDIVEELKKIDLVTYFETVTPNELVRESNSHFCTKTHDSLKMSNGKWNWFSKGYGGKNALDFIMKTGNIKFYDALNLLANKMNISISNEKDFEQSFKIFNDKNYYKSKDINQQEKHIILPRKNENNKRVFAYLLSRGIDKEIISYCINNKLLYEEAEHHNVVFLGYDEQNEVKFGCARASNQTRFMMDLKGSSKKYSFRLLSKERNDTVHIFESAIDLLSYATLLKMWGMNFRSFNLISLSGVYQTANRIEDSKVPVVLQNFLEKHNEINSIVLHLDNDIAGRNATKALQFLLGKRYEIQDNPSTFGKDINDFLVQKLKENERKSKNFER